MKFNINVYGIFNKVRNKTIDYLKKSWVNLLTFFLSFLMVLSSATVFDNGSTCFDNFSKYMTANGFESYQISTKVDNTNYEISKNCLKNYRSQLGSAYYSMDVNNTPLSYLYTDANKFPDSSILLEDIHISPITFSSFGVSSSNENGSTFYLAGNSNIELMFEKNATDSSCIDLYISDKVASSIIEKLGYSDYKDLVGFKFSQHIKMNPFENMIISNIYYSESKQSKELSKIYGEFAITPRLMYLGTLTENISVAALINKKEYSNSHMIKTFTRFFKNDAEYEIISKEGNNDDLRYTEIFNNYYQNKAQFNTAHYVIIGVSVFGMIILLLFIFVFKKIDRILFLKKTNLLTILIPYFLIILIHSIISLIAKISLFNSFGFILIMILLITLILYFVLFEEKEIQQ